MLASAVTGVRIGDAHDLDLTESTWFLADAPAGYIDRQRDAIVGVEIPTTRPEGNWKMSQDRREEDRNGVFKALQREWPSVGGNENVLI